MTLINPNGAPISSSKLRAILGKAYQNPPNNMAELLQLAVILGATFVSDQAIRKMEPQTRTENKENIPTFVRAETPSEPRISTAKTTGDEES